MKKKIKVGIDINEILRAKWLQFDRFYVEEFGIEGVPQEEPYVYDFFKYYKFEDKIETIKELKEPEDTPENINPIDYEFSEKLGQAPADAFLFKKPEEIKLTAKEVYNRFMYEDYCFEIHGAAPMMYKGMDLHLNNFLLKYGDSADFILYSVENYFSIPPTLFFLSKISNRFKTIRFVNKAIDMLNEVDILITTDPEILMLSKPWGKKIIKMERPYNKNINTGSIIKLHINDLINDKKFEKIIKYKNKE